MVLIAKSRLLTGHGVKDAVWPSEGGTTALGEHQLATTTARADKARGRSYGDGGVSNGHTFHPVANKALLLPSGGSPAATLVTSVNWDGVIAAIDDWRKKGFSVHLSGIVPHFDAETHWVSIKGHEAVFNHPPARTELGEYVDTTIGILSQPNHLIGGWVKDGLFYLDVSVPIEGRERALQFAWDNHQDSVWHPETGRSIKVEVPGDVSDARPAVV